MVTNATYIDKVTIRIDFDCSTLHGEIMSRLLGNIMNDPSWSIEKKNIAGNETNDQEFLMYSHLAFMGTISTKTILNINNSFEYIHVLTLTFDNLKSYNDLEDNSSLICLLECCVILNQHNILYNLSEINICLDAVCEEDHSVAMKIKEITMPRSSNMVRITHISKHILENNIRRLKLGVNLEGFTNRNVNMQSLKEATDIYDFFYLDYEDAFRTIFGNIFSEPHEIEALNIEEYLYLNIDVIEDFIRTLFSAHENIY